MGIRKTVRQLITIIHVFVICYPTNNKNRYCRANYCYGPEYPPIPQLPPPPPKSSSKFK